MEKGKIGPWMTLTLSFSHSIVSGRCQHVPHGLVLLLFWGVINLSIQADSRHYWSLYLKHQSITHKIFICRGWFGLKGKSPGLPVLLVVSLLFQVALLARLLERSGFTGLEDIFKVLFGIQFPIISLLWNVSCSRELQKASIDCSYR